MKKLLAAILIVALSPVLLASAVEKSEVESRLAKVITKFESMQAKPDKAVPADVLAKARGIVLLDRTKAGFIFAYSGGTGVAMVKDKAGDWGPLAFLKATEASLGFQVGGQKTFIVMVLMNDDAARTLGDSSFEFGGEASGTAGNASSSAEGKIESTERSILFYNDKEGLFGGAAVKGGALSPDTDANLVYYGQPVTVREILFENKVKRTASADSLAKKISEMAKGKK